MARNPFRQIRDAAADHPPDEQPQVVTEAIHETIPFVGTADLAIQTYTSTQVTARLHDAPRVHNHIGGLHAAAMALLVETVTGLVVALNVPDASTPVLRAMELDFQRRAAGALQATATLTEAEASRIRARPLGKIDVPVTLSDASDQAPLACAMQWAWLPKARVLDS